MNDRIRSILRTVWNEPRHFCFWLGMLSTCGFIAAAGTAALLGPTVLLSTVALVSILCFVVSIPAFILAWLPPIRRLFSWVLCRRFLALGCLVTLIALFYAVEDWRGRHAWQGYKHAREAKGERFDLAGLVPPPVTPDQNFFETALWEDLRWAATNRAPILNNPEQEQRVIFSVYSPKDQNAPSAGNWVRAQRVDLAAWQAYYRGTNNVFAAKGSPPTNYFPVAQQPQAPAADVLLALSKFSANRQLLIASAARPEARFWINPSEGFGLLLPHLARLKGTSQYLALHSTAALGAGDRDTALEDLRLSFRLIDTIRREPTIISQLVRIALLQIAVQPVWEGLASRQWTEADLRAIESELGKLDFLADYQVAIRGERACNVWGVDYFRRGGVYAVVDSPAPSNPSWPLDLEQFLGLAAFHLIPAGWFDQNKLSLCRMHETYLLPLVGDKNRRVVSPASVQKATTALAQRSLRPYDVFTRMLLPSLSRFAEKCARAQNTVDLARIACALERCRLADGQFPVPPESLAPRFMEGLPPDVINGQPLKYRRTDDGQFVLYSVGWNETDDGGTVGLNKYGNFDSSRGDWVWRYPAK